MSRALRAALLCLAVAASFSCGDSGSSASAPRAPADLGVCRARRTLHRRQLGADGDPSATFDDLVVGRLKASAAPGAAEERIHYRVDDPLEAFALELGSGAIVEASLLDAAERVVAHLGARRPRATVSLAAGDYVLILWSQRPSDVIYAVQPVGCSASGAGSAAALDPNRTTPGVYVAELSGVAGSIAPTGTANTAFVGSVEQGPIGEPMELFGAADFAALYGPESPRSPLGVAVGQFFANGGAVAWVIGTGASGEGGTPTASDLIGDASAGTGVAALAPLADVQVVVVPELVRLAPSDATTVLEALAPTVAANDLLLLVDPPSGLDEPASFRSWVLGGVESALAASLPDVAAYFPLLTIDPGAPMAPVTVGPAAVVAGVLASNDENRGVWQPPAGPVGGAITSAVEPTVALDDAASAELSSAGINPVRVASTQPGAPPVVWGARTLAAPDRAPLDRLAVSRTVAMIRRAIQRGLAWTTFETNDAALWSAVTTQVTVFLTALWQAGALAGSTEAQAFSVVCDETNNPPDAILNGELTVDVALFFTGGAENPVSLRFVLPIEST